LGRTRSSICRSYPDYRSRNRLGLKIETGYYESSTTGALRDVNLPKSPDAGYAYYARPP
jgi:hypothetical protein